MQSLKLQSSKASTHPLQEIGHKIETYSMNNPEDVMSRNKEDWYLTNFGTLGLPVADCKVAKRKWEWRLETGRG